MTGAQASQIVAESRSMFANRAFHRLAVAAFMLVVFAPAGHSQDSQKARLRVLLPAADVELEIQGVPLKKKPGVEVRLFESPLLEPGKNYIYDIKATWMENGKPVVRERSVKVIAGKTTELDLRVEESPAPETPPKNSTPSKSDKPTPAPTTEKPGGSVPADNNVTPTAVVDAMLKLGKIRETDTVYVLGCADGRIAIAAAAKSHPRKVLGVDSHANTIEAARKNAEENKLTKTVEFRTADPAKMAEKDFADANVILIDNLLPKHLAELAPALKRLKAGTRIVVHNFELPGVKFSDKRDVVVNEIQYTLYVYELK